MEPKDCCYEEMSKGTKVLEEFEVPTDDAPYQNAYELKRNSAFDQSGFKK